MSLRAITWAFDQVIRPSTLKFLLVAMSDYANEDTCLAFPSIETLATKTCMDRKTVIRNLQHLVKLNYISETEEKCGSSQRIKVYHVHFRDRVETVPKTGLSTPMETVPKTGLSGGGDSPKNGTEIVPKTELSPNLLTVREPEVQINRQSEGIQEPLVSDPTPEATPKDTSKPPPQKTDPRIMKIPTLEEVKLAAAKTGLPELEAEKFWNYFESKGWKVGREPMKKWIQALAGWKCRWIERTGGYSGPWNGGRNGFQQGNGTQRPPTSQNPVAVRISLESELKRCDADIVALGNEMQYDWDRTPERRQKMKDLKALKQSLLDQLAVVPRG